jgi:phage I-like protein
LDSENRGTMRTMDASSIARAGGDSGANPRKLLGFSHVETASAPAFGVEAADAAPPEWIQLIPAGNFHGRDGRGPYLLADPTAVINATMALRMQAGIPIDYDHATDFAAAQGNPAPAAGWITEFAIRNGAIWGRVEWTERAACAIRAHEYRYISPVFQYSPKDGAITRLLRAGLTNNPNLYLTAISAAGDEESKMDEFLKQLREMLGLDADASTDDILKRLGAMSDIDAAAAHRAGNDPARYVAVAEFQQALTELNALKMQRAREKAEYAVDEAIRSGRLAPAHREWAIAYCAADQKGFDTFAARQPVLLPGELNLGGDPRTVLSRSHSASLLSATEIAICGLLGVTANDFVQRKSGGADFLRLNKEHSDPNL